jgi:4-hydroxybutyryl-CoA dehydratase/vinylacetyl-CoA-Delta-isomerase
MALKSGAQYLEEMKAMRPNVYKYGKLIEDVTTDPATKGTLMNTAAWYDMSLDPEKQDLYTTISYLSGERAHRWTTVMTTADDVIGDAKMKRDGYRVCGSCMGPVCAGWGIMNALWGVTYDMDAEYGTDYHERLKKFAAMAEEKALAMCGAITDAKGNRKVKAGMQPNPNVFLHVDETREDGIVVSGFKIQICGTAAAQWIMAMPTQGFKEGEEKFAVAFATPKDAEGITIVETTRPSDNKVEAGNWDAPVSGTTQAFILFDKVFVPKEYVFMNGETKYSGRPIGNFSSIYRSAIGACVAGQGDVMIGAAIAMARANGLQQKAFQDKLTDMAIRNETTYGLGIGAIAMGRQHKSGAFYPNAILAHTNKYLVGTLPTETKRLAQEIAGGICETGCMPSYEDMTSPIYGKELIAAMEAGVSGEDRYKMARLVEWLTVGAGIPGCMHGGGSPDTAKAVVKAMTKWEDYVDYAKSLAGTEADFKEEPPVKK